MADFSLALNEDQQQLKKWIHDFAEDVMRPAAEEWDEREEFPWPVVQEAAKIGLYGFDFIANAMLGDPTGLTMPIAIEEMFWGDAGIGLAIMGSGLAAAGIVGQRHARADHRVGAPVLRHARRRQARRLLRVRARRRLRRVARCAPGPSTTRPRTSGCSTAPRRGSPTAASPTSTWSSPPSIPSCKGRGQASFIVPPNTPGLSQGQKYKKHGIRASHTAEVVLDDVRRPRLLPARRQGQARREAGPGPRGAEQARSTATSGKQPAMATFEATRPAVGAQAVGVARAAYEYALEYAKEREAFGKPIIMNQSIAFMLANMCTQIDAARLLVWRAAWLSRNGAVHERRGLDVQAHSRPHRGVGHRAGHPDPRRLRLHPRVRTASRGAWREPLGCCR